MAVALGAPRTDGHRGPAGGGAPVDGAGVVAGDVVAEAVELGALTARQEAGAAVEFAEPGQPGGQVLAAGEGRQDADRPGDGVCSLAGEEAERSVRTDRHAVGVAVAAAGGQQTGGQAAAFSGGDDEVVPGRRGFGGGEPGARGPGVADAGAERAGARVGHRQVHVGRFAQAYGGVAGAVQPQGADGRGEGVVDRAGHGEGAVDREHARPARFEEAYGDAAESREQRGASGEGHQRGTGTWVRIAEMTESEVTPSISASGRSCTRWRRVGRARAFTSSGVT